MEEGGTKKTPMDSPGEDSLDAFMNATVAELRQDKGDKLQKRLEDTKETGIKERIKERIKGQGTNESRSARSAPPSELDVKLCFTLTYLTGSRESIGEIRSDLAERALQTHAMGCYEGPAMPKHHLANVDQLLSMLS
jgi:hypothetical protein